VFKALSHTEEEDANECPGVVMEKMKRYCIGEVTYTRLVQQQGKTSTEALDNLIAELKRTLAKSCNLCDFLRFLHDTLIYVRLVLG